MSFTSVKSNTFAQQITYVNIDSTYNPAKVEFGISLPDLQLIGVTKAWLIDSVNTQVFLLFFEGCDTSPNNIQLDTFLYAFVPYPFRFALFTYRDSLSGCPYPDSLIVVDSIIIDPPTNLSAGSLHTSFYKSLTIFPNPTANAFHIKADRINEKPIQLSILSLDGRFVKNIKVNNYDDAVSVFDLQPGIYIVQLQTANGVYTEKLSIVR